MDQIVEFQYIYKSILRSFHIYGSLVDIYSEFLQMILLEQEQHPTTKDWVASLFSMASKKGVKLDWVNCGLCVDERGAGDWIEGPRRGGPKDFLDASSASDATLVIPTK